MKKILFFIFLSQLIFGFNRVIGVISEDKNGNELKKPLTNYEYGKHFLPCPIEPLGYICQLTMPTAQTKDVHYNRDFSGFFYGMIVGVAKYKDAQNYMTVDVISLREDALGQNETVIDNGYSTSDKLLWVDDYGYYYVNYYLLDYITADTKKITVTICPKWHGPTETLCAFSVAYIRGPAPYHDLGF